MRVYPLERFLNSAMRMFVLGIFFLLGLPGEADSNESGIEFQINDKNVYSLLLEASYDTLDITDFYSEIDIELPNGIAFQVGAGKTDYRFNDGFGDPFNYFLGFSTARFKRYIFGLSYDHWGVDRELLSDTFTADFTLNTTDWVIRLSPSLRNIELFSRTVRGRQSSTHTQSLGVEGEVIYFGFPNWAFSVTAAGFDYDNDPTRLDTLAALRRFNPGALQFSRGFLDHRYAAEVKRFFAWGALGLEAGRSTSAVTGSEAELIAIESRYYVANKVTLYLDVGTVRPEQLEDSIYTTLALGLQW